MVEAEDDRRVYVSRVPRETAEPPSDRDSKLLALCAELRGVARRVEPAGLPAAALVCGQRAEMLLAAIPEHLAGAPETWSGMR